MIHGHITPDGQLVLKADTSTEEYALLCWQAAFEHRGAEIQPTTIVVECNAEVRP